MARFKNPLENIRLVYKRSSNVTKIVVLGAIVICTAALLILGSAIQDAEERADALRQQASRLEQDNNRLEALIDSLGTVAGIEQIAREELGLVPPDSVVITPSN